MNGDPLHQLKDIEDLHSSPKTFKIKEFELVPFNGQLILFIFSCHPGFTFTVNGLCLLLSPSLRTG